MAELSQHALSYELNTAEAGRVLGMPDTLVRAWCRAGHIEHQRLGGPTTPIRITVGALLQWRYMRGFDADALAAIVDGIEAKERLGAAVLERELSPMDASMVLGCCERTVWNLCRSGKLTYRRLWGSAGPMRVKLGDLIQWRSRPGWDEDLWEFFTT